MTQTTAQSAPTPARPRAVVTGASSGIGEATAITLAAAGYDLVVGARRRDRLDELASRITGDYPETDVAVVELDVADPACVETLEKACEGRPVDVLVNNAGGAIGTDRVEDADPVDWQRMYEVNVLGVLRVTQALLPCLRAAGRGTGARPEAVGTVVTIGSIAAHEPYPGGAGYNASKHGVRAVSEVLRQELLGEPIRVCEVDPGLVSTEFSLRRFAGDSDRAAGVYQGLTPLVAEDIADIIAFVVSRPPHVNIDSLLVLCTAQVGARTVVRDPEPAAHSLATGEREDQ